MPSEAEILQTIAGATGASYVYCNQTESLYKEKARFDAACKAVVASFFHYANYSARLSQYINCSETWQDIIRKYEDYLKVFKADPSEDPTNYINKAGYRDSDEVIWEQIGIRLVGGLTQDIAKNVSKMAQYCSDNEGFFEIKMKGHVMGAMNVNWKDCRFIDPNGGIMIYNERIAPGSHTYRKSGWVLQKDGETWAKHPVEFADGVKKPFLTRFRNGISGYLTHPSIMKGYDTEGPKAYWLLHLYPKNQEYRKKT